MVRYGMTWEEYNWRLQTPLMSTYYCFLMCFDIHYSSYIFFVLKLKFIYILTNIILLF